MVKFRAIRHVTVPGGTESTRRQPRPQRRYAMRANVIVDPAETPVVSPPPRQSHS